MFQSARALAWGAAILLVALIARSLGMSAPAAAGLVFALVGASIGSLSGRSGCRRGCAS